MHRSMGCEYGSNVCLPSCLSIHVYHSEATCTFWQKSKHVFTHQDKLDMEFLLHSMQVRKVPAVQFCLWKFFASMMCKNSSKDDMTSKTNKVFLDYIFLEKYYYKQ